MLKKIKHLKKYQIIELIILTIIILILINTLFINPIIGRKDNGDFQRLYLYGGLENISQKYKDVYDGFLHTNYKISSPSILLIFYKDWVSETILLKIAVIIFDVSHLFLSNLFDIRYLAFTYSIVFLIGIFLILNFKKFSNLVRIVAGIFIILFFTDTAYLSYFNSFFGEAGTIAFFFLTIGTYLNLIGKEKPKKLDFIWFFIASSVFLTSKAQELPLIFFMIIIYAALFYYYREKNIRKCIVISSLVVIVLCTASYLSLTSTMNENNMYQSVFSGVLMGSKTPKSDLNELGVDKRFIKFYGQSFYKSNPGKNPVGEDMMKNFYPKLSPVKILFFYLNHPDRLWQKIVDSANNAYNFTVPSKYNFEKGQYSKNKLVNNFRTCLIKKYPMIHHNIYFFIIFSLVYLVTSIIYFVTHKDKSIRLLILMLLFILAAGSSQFILPVIGSGHGDFGKHLFLLNFSYDIMYGVFLAWFINSGVFILKKLSNSFFNFYQN